MADISKITIVSTTYNIKDASARESLDSIGTASNFIVKERVWGSQVSVSSGTPYFNQSINVTKSNYTPVCLSGFGVTNGSNGSNYTSCQAYKGYLNGNSATVYIRQFSGTTALVQPYVDVIYRRT